MSSIDIIKAPIRDDIRRFEPFFREIMKSRAPLLNIITNYIVKRKGKQMRPILVFLSAKLHGDINIRTFHAASLIELMHTATLIHDDVVDDSNERRNFFSINALWKNKIAVLVGDYLLAKGLLMAVENEEFELLKIVSEVVREMSEGELLQMEKARNLDITEEVYFDIIRKKTATLIASCSASGARSVCADPYTVRQMWEFGENIGIAFQIKDDIFDYQSNGSIGKPTGNDIKEKKMTLPLIHVLNNADRAEKRSILCTVRKNKHNPEKVKNIIQTVQDRGGIDYAAKVMKIYTDKAVAIIEQFPNNEARESLVEFIDYSIQRKK